MSDPAKLFSKRTNVSAADELTKDRSKEKKTTLSCLRVIMGSLYVTIFGEMLQKLVKHVPLTTHSPSADIILINDGRLCEKLRRFLPG